MEPASRAAVLSRGFGWAQFRNAASELSQLTCLIFLTYILPFRSHRNL